MNEHFVTYLTDLGISTVLMEEIKKIYKLCVDLCPEEIEDILLEDFYIESGHRDYEAINFFSKNYIIGKHIYGDNKISLIPLCKSIKKISIDIIEFDLVNVKPESRMRLYLPDINYELKAASDNCLQLVNVYEKYIKPNYKK